MKVIEKSGHCANCESSNIEYLTSDIDNEQVLYDYKCLDCNNTGIEYYALNYIETISDKE